MTSKTHTRVRAGSPEPESLGTAEAKRRFSELVDRVGEGERFLVSRRGRPAVALVPPAPDLLDRREPPTGLATLAGVLVDWNELEDDVAEIYAARLAGEDRPAPELD
jgi:prevent-host-death family protein